MRAHLSLYSYVGIALGSGTDVAMETGNIVLVTSIELSRTTMRKIKQNLFWAFAYNLILIPIAAGALYPFLQVLMVPTHMAVAHACSSIAVVANASLLKRFTPKM